MSPKYDLSVKIAGAAGLGIKVAGYSFSKAAMRHGLNVIDYTEYPSLIRGGHNVFFARVASGEMFAHRQDIDILVALNRESIEIHKNELNAGGKIIYDPESFEIQPEVKEDNLCPVPLAKIVKETGGKPIMLNTAALGALMAVAGLKIEPLLGVLAESFAGKAEEIIKNNQLVAQAGHDFTKSNCRQVKERPDIENKEKVLLEGNEAIALGAVQAGCRFFAAYPMTPSSSILHFMAEHDEEFGIVVKHAEDEIAVMNMAVGAGFAGARSMVATSGGGFCLMVEAFGLAGVSETPVVVVEVQRAGPATGMPTWHEQGDAFFVLNAAQGEFPRIVLTPGDIEECFFFAHQAFNIAEIIQTPVVLLSDLYLSESHQTGTVFDISQLKIDRGKLLTDEKTEKQGEYLRYRLTEDGISPRSIPGQQNCRFIANSYEHDKYGYAEESAQGRANMNAKRMRKMDKAALLVPRPKRFGEKVPKVGIISWGSTKRPILQAMADLKSEISAGYLHITCLNPFPTEDVKRFLSQCDTTIVVENNYTGQLHRLIRMNGIQIDEECLRKYDGRPLYAEEVVSKVREVSQSGIVT